MTYQERNRIDADAVEKAANFMVRSIETFNLTHAIPYNSGEIANDVAYVFRHGGNFGGVYIRSDLLTRVRDSVLTTKGITR